jgi:HAD superfamily hydrolase (TIGR01450 family)
VLLLVDLDGVVYRGSEPVPGVAEVLRRRVALGDRVIYVTNNSRSHREEYRARLEQVGVPLGDDPFSSILTAARATAVLLAEAQPPARLAMVFGGPGLARELGDVGIATCPPTEEGLEAEPDTLVVGVDFDLTYERLSIACECVRRGARFWATNRDAIYPGADRLMAGAGSMVAAVAYATGREPDIVVGKPEPRLFEAAAASVGMPVSEAIVIGDNLTTDIGAARAVGARSVLMLTGVTSRAEADLAKADAAPTAIAHDAAELDQVLDRLSADSAPAAPAFRPS